MYTAILAISLAVCVVAIAAMALAMRRQRHPEGPSPYEIESRLRTEMVAERNEALARQEKYFASLLAETENRFRVLSQKVLDERSDKLKRESSEHLALAMAPLQKDIKSFREKMEFVNDAAIRRGGKLEEKIASLAEKTNLVSAEASELAKAIRGEARVTGQWGEIQLRRVIELAGLVEGIDYTYQETLESAESMRRDLRTDVIVKMPNGKCFVIDSKNTMDAYVDYVASDEAERDVPYAKIVESVRNHVDEMKSAAYQKHIKGALDFAFMYIPFEEVYLIAMKAEVKLGGERILLREYARKAGVIFANSTSLLPTLHVVSLAWASQDVDKKAEKIRDAAEALCGKFETFLATYEKMGKTLARMFDDYETGLKQLSTGNGNMIRRLKSLGELGIESAKRLPDDGKVADAGRKLAEKAFAVSDGDDSRT